MEEKLLNDQDYKQILHRRFGRSDIKLIGASIKPLSENVEGFMGEHYKLDINYELDGETKVGHFFIKTKPAKNEEQRDLTTRSNFYQFEQFLYFLFQEFERYGFDTSFAPKCYYCVKDETLVMDDLTRKGFYVPERDKFFDLESCKWGLRTLVLLHSAGLMYEEVKKKELGRGFSLKEEYPDMFRERFCTIYVDRENSWGAKWYEASIEVFNELINFLAESEEYKAEFKKRLREKKLGKIFIEETNIKKFLSHGDLWSNNILLKTENGVVTQCRLVDYQICRYFYPAYDTLLFIHSNTSAEFRQKHLKGLLEFYYTTLEDTLKKHGYTLAEFYPKEDYEKSLELTEFEVKMQAYSIHSFVYLPADILNKHLHGGGDILFSNRVAPSLDSFKNDENYKKVMTDDLYELHATLFRE